MSKIKEDVRRLAVNGGEFSGGLERVMEGLEDELYEFKCAMRKGFDVLVVKENNLSSEVEELRGKVKEWEKKPRMDAPAMQPTAGSRPSTAAAAATQRRSAGEENGIADEGVEEEKGAGTEGEGKECRGVSDKRSGGDSGQRRREGYGDAVEQINSLIQREGGTTGGWPQHEHDCFLRLWTQARSRGPKHEARPPPSSPADRAAVSSLLQRAQTMLPARSADEVEEHLRWHGRHMGYNEEKRRLAKAWREERQHEQQADAETNECPNGTCGESTPNGDTNGKVKTTQREDYRRSAAAAEQRERERKRKEVEAWRAAKEAKEREKREREERRRADEAAKFDEERRRQRRQHEQVAAYRLDREREDNRRLEVERMLAREQKRVMFSQADIEDRAKRDVDRARARRQEVALKELHQKEAEQRKKAAACGRWVGVEADRSRLLRGTKASKERMIEPEDLDDLEDQRASLPAHCSPIAISGRDLRFNQGRAVPAWRRGCL
ncbi:unnamed protein product [Ectocarpus sp. 12 AP-2014]